MTSTTPKRSDEDQKIAEGMFNSFRDELNKRQLSNTENYDKAILTLSSAGLAISLTFLKTIIPLASARYVVLMKISWWSFLASIILSLVAYLVSNEAITREMGRAEKYYLEQNESVFSKANTFSVINNCLNKIIGLFFSCAVIMLVLFFTLNVQNKDNQTMTDKKSTITFANDSAKMPTMQKVPSHGESNINSAQMPKMQAVPSSTPVAQSTQQKPSATADKD
jgi:hypothetical protein